MTLFQNIGGCKVKYNDIIKASFIERKNRFVATVRIGDTVEIVHIKNTGRCKELFLPDVEVYLSPSSNTGRKTKYDLISLIKPKSGMLINVDSQAPNTIAAEWLIKNKIFSECSILHKEVRYKNSRFDLYVEDGNKRCFIEVKGVTLESNGVALFPDAPTERGVKHINELIDAVDDGYEAWVIFVIKMKGISSFQPNRFTHPEFAEALLRAQTKGVKLVAIDCIVTPDEVIPDNSIDIVL